MKNLKNRRSFPQGRKYYFRREFYEASKQKSFTDRCVCGICYDCIVSRNYNGLNSINNYAILQTVQISITPTPYPTQYQMEDNM